jgi:hypothetical protein
MLEDWFLLSNQNNENPNVYFGLTSLEKITPTKKKNETKPIYHFVK